MSILTRRVRWAQPFLMDWTIMPITVTAKAWVDSAFKSALLSSPDVTLQQMSRRWPHTIAFTLHEDTSTTRNLPLPVYKTSLQGLSDADLLSLAQDETGGDETLEYFLPARVIVKAFVDPQFKSDLLTDANLALNGMGYDTGYATYTVHENTASSHHLALQVNPLSQQDLSFEDLVNRLLSAVGSGSTKCCASGTCDDDDDR